MHIMCQPWHAMPKTPHFFEKNRIYIAFFPIPASRCLRVPFLAHIKNRIYTAFSLCLLLLCMMGPKMRCLA